MTGNGRDLYGIAAAFARSSELVAAVAGLREAGYEALETFSPQPVAELESELDATNSPIPRIMLLGALLVGCGFYGLEYWLAVVHYPHDIGGRPAFAWSPFLFPALEMTLLGAAAFGLAGMLSLDRLPRLHHPLFDVPEFARASRDRYFVCIRSTDDRFEAASTRALIESFDPETVHEVER
jgi:hypothetical protein